METQYYKLEDIESADINHIHKGLSDPEITKYYDVHFPTLEATREQMDWYASLVEKGEGKWWKIIDKETYEFCGAGGFSSLNKDHKKAEIGFWLLKSHWGKGIMKEVMPKLFELGFTEFNLNRIEAYVDSENIFCKNVLSKINFVHEGTMREAEITNHRKIDLEYYAILKKDWNK